MTNTLRQAFPRPHLSPWGKLRVSIIEGVGVAFFFWIFKPFGMGSIADHQAFPWAYGGIVLAVTLSYRIVLPFLFPRYFMEQYWTVGREIAGVIGILVSITSGILLFHVSYYESAFAHPLMVFFIVVFLGSIPVSLSVLSRLAFLNSRYSRPQIPVQMSPAPDLTLVAENGKDRYGTKDLLFVEITDNYATLVYLDHQKVLIRSSLSKLEQQANGTPVVRCHRSYLVNLDRVVRVSGNAQGYRLHFENSSETVPVSRKYASRVVRDPKSLDTRPKVN